MLVSQVEWIIYETKKKEKGKMWLDVIEGYRMNDFDILREHKWKDKI